VEKTRIQVQKPDQEIVIGWREWVALPELDLPAIKAKIDTGAKTSALHAFYIERFTRNKASWVRFGIHPLPRKKDVIRHCEAPIIEQRTVYDSGRHKDLRYVIVTPMTIGPIQIPIELTLTNRDRMRFRMLLGRRALDHQFIIHPGASYMTGRLKRKAVNALYSLDTDKAPHR